MNRDQNERRKAMQRMLDKHYRKRGLKAPIIPMKINWDLELSKLPRRNIGEE